ncbi:hypothetical protein [Elizabethkingia ursingii]|uniref:Uncharacterized protein n=1 Tax=Elizabethkingia ursingii TaxID=1756150 RepID=A0ABX3N8L5_9FLAO|nr:hypothetical protein [Elizabethkingia ursingii]OPB88523.1 hypothetical protein BB021_08225 [Elizabethkingia ursingii]
MDKKEIQINRGVLSRVLLGFLLAFITVFIIEHFSSFSYIPDTSNLPTYTPEGKIILSQSYNQSTTKVAVLNQITPFGTKISLPTAGLMCSDLIYAGTDFKDYSNKAELYFKAVFKDFIYLILFWMSYVLILLFFKKYQIKITK